MLGRIKQGQKATVLEMSVAIQALKASSCSLKPEFAISTQYRLEEQTGFYYKGNNRGQLQTNKAVGQEKVRFGEDGAQMLSGVNISMWEQPQKEARRATEGAIVPLC